MHKVMKPLNLWLAAVLLTAGVYTSAHSNAAFANAPGQPEEVLQPAIWEGMAECGRGTTYLTLSIDINPHNRRSDQAAGRLDFAATPGGRPIARNSASIFVRGDKIHLNIGSWTFRPMDLEPLIGRYSRIDLTVSPDGSQMTTPSFGSCKNVRFQKLPATIASGGIRSAEDLPPVFEGRLGCFGDAPIEYMRLEIEPDGTSSFEGRVLLRRATYPLGETLIHSAFGEFDPETSTVTVIGDRWIKQSPRANAMSDFTATLLQNGQRIVGSSEDGRCGIVDLHVPGTDALHQITAPSRPLSPELWDTPSGCATLIGWAYQAAEESDGKSLFRGMMASQAEEVAIGLFADERFVPYFGNSFDEMSPEQRQRVLKVEESCRNQLFSRMEIYESGANLAITHYFPDRNSAAWIKLKRFNILRKRLSEEMVELEATAVGERDISSLEARLQELPERFSELWEVDLASARALINSKIDTAKGAMIARLEDEIDALALSFDAFEDGRSIRRQIPALGQDRRGDQTALNAKLDTRLAEAGDAVLLGIDEQFADREPSLNALEEIRQRIEFVWPQLEPFVAGNKPGFNALAARLSHYAEASFPTFESKTGSMIDQSAPFEMRAYQYRAAMGYYSQVVPSSHLFAGVFRPFSVHIEGLRPVPTLRDVVEDDGSPTGFGLRNAVADYVEETWALTFAFFPFDLSFVTNLVSVGDVVKESCEEASAGGYWCDFQLSISSSLPFSGMMSDLPSRARVMRNDLIWRVVETPPQQYTPSAAYDEADRRHQQWQQHWNDVTMEGLMMN